MPGVDFLKLVLALMVVGIHANPFVILGRPVQLATGEGLYRLAVPVFLIFNGYFLQGAITAGRGWGYVRRALQLYVIWMLIYLPVAWPLWASLDLWPAIRMAIFGYWHLWYLSALAMAASAAVLLRDWSSAGLLRLAGGLFAAALVLLAVMSAGLWKPWPVIFTDPLPPLRNAVVMGLPFLLLGVVIRREGLAARWPRQTVLWACGAALLLVLVESWTLAAISVRPQSHDLMASLILAAPLLVIAALQWPPRFKAGAMGAYSSGIYFLHVIFVALLLRHTEIKQWGYGSAPVWVIAVIGSVALTWGIRRSRLDRWLL